MSDWKTPLPNYSGTKRNHRPTYAHNSGSMMLQFELINEISETDNAHLLIFKMDERNIGRWLPKSQIKIPFADVVEIPRWLVDRIKDEMKQWTE